MMIKSKRLISIILTCVTLVSVLAVGASATADKPYSDADVTLTIGTWGGADTATACITRCDCMPVENYLFAGLKVQYEVDGNDYLWYPSKKAYIYDSGHDVGSAKISYKEHYIYYIDAWFQAQCDTGEKVSFFEGKRR